MLAKVFQGSAKSTMFEELVEQLLPLCGRWPQPRSVLIVDDASIHHSDRVRRICEEAGAIAIVYS